MVNPDFDFEKAKNYTTQEKLGLLLTKLYDLKSVGYWPVEELLSGNGVEIEELEEPLEYANTLKDNGWIDWTHDDKGAIYAKLNTNGKLFVEQKLKKNRREMSQQNKKAGKIFVSHATKDREIASKFCDLILGNGLNIPTKEIFNTSHQGTKPKTGQDFKKAIKDELINAKVVLQFISKSYKISEACLTEMGAAWVLSDNVKPLVVEKGEYEVGFIHSTTQQAQLHNTEHITRLTDELRDEGIYEGVVKNEVLFKKINEFVAWLTEYDKTRETGAVKNLEAKEENKKNYTRDVQVIRTYLQTKNLMCITIDGLSKFVNPKYNLDYIIGLIEEHPDKFTRVTVQNNPAIKILHKIDI